MKVGQATLVSECRIVDACTGHGYIQSNGQEQIARDVRISSVWEGTTQIQALDLLGRKIMLEKMKPLTEYVVVDLLSYYLHGVMFCAGFSVPSLLFFFFFFSLMFLTFKFEENQVRLLNPNADFLTVGTALASALWLQAC